MGESDRARTLLRNGQDSSFERRVNNTWSLDMVGYGLAAAELGETEAAAMERAVTTSHEHGFASIERRAQEVLDALDAG